MEPKRNMVIAFPFLRNRPPGFPAVPLHGARLTYQLFVGERMSEDLRRLCSLRSPGRYVLMVPDANATNMEGMARSRRQDAKSGLTGQAKSATSLEGDRQPLT